MEAREICQPVKIFFFHNQKAGGTSVAHALRALFPAPRCGPLIVNSLVDHEQLGGEYTRFRGYDYYGGHYGRDLFDAVADGHLQVTNFRDPAARLVSHYNYFRYGRHLSPAELETQRYFALKVARSASFLEFVSSDDPRLTVYTDNPHFRQLTGSCWSPEISETLLPAACRAIDEMHWFYVCEQADLSRRWADHAFSSRLPALARRNVTTGPTGDFIRLEELDARTGAIVDQRTRLDRLLYEHAVRRLLAFSRGDSQ